MPSMCVHACVQVVVPFPVQLLPNKNGLFQSIGLDSLAGTTYHPPTDTSLCVLTDLACLYRAGLAFLAVTAFFRKQQGKAAFPGETPHHPHPSACLPD